MRVIFHEIPAYFYKVVKSFLLWQPAKQSPRVFVHRIQLRSRANGANDDASERALLFRSALCALVHLCDARRILPCSDCKDSAECVMTRPPMVAVILFDCSRFPGSSVNARASRFLIIHSRRKTPPISGYAILAAHRRRRRWTVHRGKPSHVFPCALARMASSGPAWCTRTLEQPPYHPRDYPGSLTMNRQLAARDLNATLRDVKPNLPAAANSRRVPQVPSE